ncbi:MAG: phage regulatory protein/antirepressor Ant [Bacteroidales bacterium]|nr:phage regulatory protein/antirepressor Ant [Bacteroidales bacterium]
MKAPEQGKKNTVPNDNRINLHFKNSDFPTIYQSPGIIISTHYQSFRDVEQTMTTREIAQITGKRHSDVLPAVRKMEPAWEKVSGRKFSLANYIDEQGKPRPMYELNKVECLYIATKFNDEARAILVLRWEQLEIEKRQSEQLSIADRRISALEANNEENKPKIQFAEAVEGSMSTIDVETFAKALYDEVGVKMGRNALMKWFREHNYLMANNLPFQWVLKRKLMRVKEGTFRKPGHPKPIPYTQPRITGKGQLYFVNKLIEEFKPENNG